MRVLPWDAVRWSRPRRSPARRVSSQPSRQMSKTGRGCREASAKARAASRAAKSRSSTFSS